MRLEEVLGYIPNYETDKLWIKTLVNGKGSNYRVKKR
jgi:hypothetical protein